jgi:hypothetical protein
MEAAVAREALAAAASATSNATSSSTTAPVAAKEVARTEMIVNVSMREVLLLIANDLIDM